MIPKANGKLRSLGIPTASDRVVQASLKLVLEPIFEAGFHPCSYGFRPRRRPHDAIAEIHMLATNEYSVVLEGDITACFDEIDHAALLGRVRDRIGDRRVVALVKAFLKAGVLSEDGVTRDTKTGTPQGGILSPLLANIALSVLDDHFAEAWQRDMATRPLRERRRRHGHATYRLVRYADDFVVMVAGTKAHAEDLQARGRSGALHDGPAPVGGEDDDRRHRRGVRLPRVPHPAADQAGVEQAIRLHLAGEEGAGLDQGQGEDDHASRERTSRSPTCCASSTGCCAAGPTTSGTACPRRRSPTCTSSPGCAWSDGFVASIAGPTGSGCDGATWPTGGGPSMTAWRCSTVEQSR